ncbi:hypothetical protein LAZ67_21001788 [Cordylochernes scorpioides]|uniref:Uncharacterized protein n=1 Tax=Cordylochernes scorpioides TaxID=51811 RepID=A0ABY6LMF3_9ARAC|nr:hypothetical protein LAZ67_21001788 [Cordylochernes scorpioides]
MRSPLRGLMTKKVAEIKKIIENDHLNRKEILALHQHLQRLEQRVETLNGKIETLLLEEEALEDLFTADLEGCDVYERMLTRMEVEVQDPLESIATNQRERDGSTSALSEKRICKLPKFSGTLREWLPWWGQFERIHNNDTLSNVDKFHYLHQAVTKGSRAQKFLEVRTLADLYAPIMASLRLLESLEVTTDQNAVFLYPMVESRLPDDVLQIWQRRPEAGYQSEDNTKEPNSSQRLNNLLEFIKKKLEELNGWNLYELASKDQKKCKKRRSREEHPRQRHIS